MFRILDAKTCTTGSAQMCKSGDNLGEAWQARQKVLPGMMASEQCKGAHQQGGAAAHRHACAGVWPQGTRNKI